LLNMHTFYFANCCLQVSGESSILDDSQLSYFRNKRPYSTKVVLNISLDACPVYESVANVPVGSGVTVGDIAGEEWLFSRGNPENLCCLAASRDYSVLRGYIGEAEDNEQVLRENFIHLLRLAVECHLAHNNGVSVHASCVSFDKKALLFAAPAGAGKSTQAGIWERYLGARIISGDRPFLHLSGDDAPRAFGVPWDGKEQIFLQENYPVLGVMEVRRANASSLRRMSRDQAFNLMVKQCFIPMWDDAAKFSVMKTIRLLTQKVPFYRLFCTREESAAQLLHKVLFTGQKSILKKVQADLKVKEGFILKNIVDEWIVMPTGKNIKNFEGAIILNDVSAFIWRKLEKSISRDDILQAVLDEFDIDRQTAAADLDEFLGKIEDLGILHRGL